MKNFFNPAPVIISFVNIINASAGDSLLSIKNQFVAGADAVYLTMGTQETNPAIVMSAGTHMNEKGLLLENLFAEFIDKKFILNFLNKESQIIKDACLIIKNYHAEERIIAASNHGKVLRLIHSILPGMGASFTPMGILGFYALFRTRLLHFKKRFSGDVLFVPEYIGGSHIANKGLITEAHEKGICVYVFVGDDKNQILRLQQTGIDGYITEKVAFLKQVLTPGC